MQPAITFYQDVLEGSPSDVEAEFELWRTKCGNGSVSGDNAFDAFECCPSIYPNIKFLLQILQLLHVTSAENMVMLNYVGEPSDWFGSVNLCHRHRTQDQLKNLKMSLSFFQHSSHRTA